MTKLAARAAAAALAVATAGAAPLMAQEEPARVAGSAVSGDGWADWVLSARSSHHNDALPLALSGADDARLLTPRPGRNLAYVDDELRLSRQRGGWSLALLTRSYGTLVAGQAALDLAAQLAHGVPPAGDRDWPVALQLRSFTGAGLAVGRTQALGGGWRISAEFQALQLQRWHERRIDGGAQYGAAAGVYAFGLRSDERNSRLALPYQDAFAARGAALLLAAGLAWEGTRTWAEFGLRDGGWLRWPGLPRQQQSLDTDTLGVDADGFVVYRPLIQGRDSQDGGARLWPWRARLAGGLVLPGGQRLGVQLERLPDFGLLPALQWQRPAATPGALALGAEWRVHERRLGLTIAWRGFTLRSGFDRLDSGARSRELGLSFQATL